MHGTVLPRDVPFPCRVHTRIPLPAGSSVGVSAEYMAMCRDASVDLWMGQHGQAEKPSIGGRGGLGRSAGHGTLTPVACANCAKPACRSPHFILDTSGRGPGENQWAPWGRSWVQIRRSGNGSSRVYVARVCATHPFSCLGPPVKHLEQGHLTESSPGKLGLGETWLI